MQEKVEIFLPEKEKVRGIMRQCLVVEKYIYIYIFIAIHR